MPANSQIGNMRGSLSSPDTEPRTPEYDSSFSRFFESSSLDMSPLPDGGDQPLANSISQMLGRQRIYTSSPNSASTPPLSNVFDFPTNDDLISNDEWPLGFNPSMHSIGRVSNMSRNEALNMQSPPIHGPRAIRGSPPYSDCSSPSRESHPLFGPRAITNNTRSNSPADSSLRDYMNGLGVVTDQELVNLQHLHAISSAAGASSASPSAATVAPNNGNAAYMISLLQNNPTLLSTLFRNLQIQQNGDRQHQPQPQPPQSWPGSPLLDGNGNDFNFSMRSSNGGSSNGSGASSASLTNATQHHEKYHECRNYYNNMIQQQQQQQMRELEEAAWYRRTTAANKAIIREVKVYWEGDFPIHVNKNPTYSVKVFLGGVPWDITEETLLDTFADFGIVGVQWPSGRDPNAASQRKGYAYVIFEADRQVKALLAACTRDLSKGPDVLFYSISSRRLKSKVVQVIPWATSDSNFFESSPAEMDPKRTVFVGALHGVMHAEFLYNTFNELFGGVIFAGIDTDRFKYPIGSARVMFDNAKSYLQAVNAEFVELRTPKFTKTVQVDPYLEDSPCSMCLHQQGPYFCKVLECFRYFCHNCWQLRHRGATALATHKPLMRNSRTNSQSRTHHQSPPSMANAQQPPAASGGNHYGHHGGTANNTNNNHRSYTNGNANADAIRGNLD